MNDLQQDIVNWLHSQQNWLQEAAFRLLLKDSLDESDIDELVSLIKASEGRQISKGRTFPLMVGGEATVQQLRLHSISDVQGIENLAPRNPLLFGTDNICVVYGNNGSGKSGYTRILKRISGKSTLALKSNVFQATPASMTCTLSYETNGVKEDVSWVANSAAILLLKSIDIFDSSTGQIYLGGESEATYVPASVALFEELVKVCDKIRHKLENQQATLTSALPAMPEKYKNTIAGKSYLALKSTQSEADLVGILQWEQTDQDELDQLRTRLKESDPSSTAKLKRGHKEQLEKLNLALSSAADLVTAAECKRIFDLKSEAISKRQIATEAMQANTASAVLAGIGSETWRALWEAARSYSIEVAYAGYSFPVVGDSSRCVLCHQELDELSKQRLQDFEMYVQGVLESVARTAENAYELAISALPKSLSNADLKTCIQAAGLDEETYLPALSSAWKCISDVVVSMSQPKLDSVPLGLDAKVLHFIPTLNQLITDLGISISQLEADALGFDRVLASNRILELESKGWTSEQSEAIRLELLRLREISMYEQLKTLTNTREISLKSGKISETVITEAYIRRFNNELILLGAKRIKVELIKTRIERGVTKHQIRLKNVKSATIRPSEILSEGENRIVALAAFLADVTAKPSKAPFIFDDPISSLDQDFEEKTIDRLISLSADRQVIVFTHRLSFLGILSDKANPEQICIRQEHWGAGEPGELPLFGKKPEKALANLRNDRLVKAEHVSQTEGQLAYYPLAKGICSDFRILIERIVETVFLADIVQRHRRQIHTQGKIGGLAKITTQDCSFVDEMMTKYSCYEHSQSLEAPVDVPLPPEIRTDIDRVITWHDEFKVR